MCVCVKFCKHTHNYRSFTHIWTHSASLDCVSTGVCELPCRLHCVYFSLRHSVSASVAHACSSFFLGLLTEAQHPTLWIPTILWEIHSHSPVSLARMTSGTKWLCETKAISQRLYLLSWLQGLLGKQSRKKRCLPFHLNDGTGFICLKWYWCEPFEYWRGVVFCVRKC